MVGTSMGGSGVKEKRKKRSTRKSTGTPIRNILEIEKRQKKFEEAQTRKISRTGI